MAGRPKVAIRIYSNNNNDQNNNNNDNNNVFEYQNNFVSMNMNTADSMGGNGALGRGLKKRRMRQALYQINDDFKISNSTLSRLFIKASTSRIYKCFL